MAAAGLGAVLRADELAGAEAGVARHIRDHFLTARNHPRHWLKAAGYWTAGKADTSDKTLA